MIRLTSLAALLASATALHAAEPAWTDISKELFDGRTLLDGAQAIAVDAPYRSPNDARTDIAARIAAPEGKTLSEVTVILDNNPMPVSAVFTLDRPLEHFAFDVTMRVNGPTPLHVVAETTDGALYMVEGYVKTSGLGACAAPPGSDPQLALETLGDITIAPGAPARTASLTAQIDDLMNGQRDVVIDVSHPSHSGMQMDQITLLFLPMRYVETLDVDLDGESYATLTGSISLSEDPSVTISVPSRTRTVGVTMTDTDGTVTEQTTSLAGS